MKTLELTLQRKADNAYPVVVALTRPGGFLPLRREGALNLGLPALSELQYDPLSYGTAIGKALFVDEIRDTFHEGLAGGEPLRVLLSIEAPDLRALDWHRLAAPMDGGRWRFLASQQNTPFSLSIPSPASAHFPAIGRRDLRALVLVAGPESLSGDYKLTPFDVEATIAGIQASLGDIPCDTLPNPSLDALCAALTATPYTILHLVCHGAVNQNGETILYFPKDSKGGPTPATDLLNRLGSLARLPHFVFLSACESALPQNGLGSLAQRLVRELGLPAVLAMTDRVSIATAGAIAAPFYKKLYEHGQPDLALAQSLAGLQGAHDLTVPAIFSRLGDRPLFDDNSERALTDQELEFGLAKLAEALPERAPVMDSLRDSLTRRLRSTLGADSKSLSESSRTERKETIDQINSLSLEALELSFNALCLGQTPPAYDSRSPFRGLESFRPENSPYFFGREALTKKLVQKLNEHNFLAVLGASGSGKSSLVMAGLIPALNVPYAVFRPGAEPLAELEKALLPSPLGRDAGGEGGPQLLVVDQFEELFTLSAREQRSDFISRLLEQVQKIRVVITLRADFLGEVAPFKSLKDEVQNHQEIIPPMDEAELRRAMEGQATCAGLRFESDLSQQMLDDVAGEPGAMPLLQHALWTLWTRRHGRWLRAEEYRAFGGVKQAIASTAEAVYARCTEFERERLRDIFLRLTRLDDSADGRDTRRRVLLRDLIPADSDPAATTLLIKQLADARLLVVTGDEVEVAHEALIRHWERLRAWLNDDRDNLRLREGVTDDAYQWNDAGRDESLLNHRSARLELALAMSKNPRYLLNRIEQAYLDACVALRERGRAAVAKRKQYAIAGVSAAMIVIMAILAGWGWTSTNSANEKATQVSIAQTAQADASYAKSTAVSETNFRATAQAESEAQTKLARGGELAVQSILLRDSKLDLALLVSVEAFRAAGTSNTKNVLIENTQVNPQLIHFFHLDKNVVCVGFSPDLKTFVTSSKDGSLTVWDMESYQAVGQPMQGQVAPNSITFSPSGKIIATAYPDGSLILWDLTTRQEWGRVMPGNIDRERLIAFSPDGKTLAIINKDGVIEFLDVATMKSIGQVNNGEPAFLAFSPDGKTLAAGWRSIRLWDMTTLQPIGAPLNSDSPYVNSLAFSADGKSIVTGNPYSSIVIWDLTQNPPGSKAIIVPDDEEGQGAIFSVGVSPVEPILVAGGTGNTVILLNSSTGEMIGEPLRGHTNGVRLVSFSRDGTKFASYGDDKTVILWEVNPHQPLAQPLLDQGEDIHDLTFVPNGEILAARSNDQTIYSWNVTGSQPVARQFTPPSAPFSMTSFSPSGKIFATDTQNGITLFDIATFRAVGQPLSENTSSSTSLVFSPDGQILASGFGDGSIRLWNVATQQPLGQPLIKQANTITRLIFSPDGKFLASIDENSIVLWESISTQPIGQLLEGASAYTGCLAFSPDGKTLVSDSVFAIDIWDIATRKLIDQIKLPDNSSSISALAFSPDGKILASTIFSKNGVFKGVFLWDLATRQVIAKLFVEQSVETLAFSPDKMLFATHDGFGTVLLWNLETPFLIEQTCRRAGRNFTRAEWAQYFPWEEYRATCPQWPLEPEPTP